MPRSSARPGPPAATSKNRQGSRRPGLSRRPARGRKRDRAATNVAKGHMGNERESRRATENVRTRERETENVPGQRDPWGSPGTRGRPQSSPRSPLPRRSREREREPSVDHFLTASRPSITSRLRAVRRSFPDCEPSVAIPRSRRSTRELAVRRQDGPLLVHLVPLVIDAAQHAPVDFHLEVRSTKKLRRGASKS